MWKISVMRGTLLYIFDLFERPSKLTEVLHILWGRYQRKTLSVIDVSINWAANRNWQTKVLDTWKVAQLNLPDQESVKTDNSHSPMENSTMRKTQIRSHTKDRYWAMILNSSISDMPLTETAKELAVKCHVTYDSLLCFHPLCILSTVMPC